MTDTYFYTLNECEAACVSWYGKHINEFAAKSGLTECKVATDRDGLQIQVEGIGAEWAFAKASQQDAQLFAELAWVAELCLGNFKVQDLVNTA